MPHIELPEGLPGILGPMAFSPTTAKPLNELAEVLLRGESSLSGGERELIASYTSRRNDCCFCQFSHAAAAAHHLGGDEDLVYAVLADPESAPVSAKLKALLAIAARVREGGATVGADDIARAREQGAGDKEIHDTVLIAAAFCMYNRYVDGLATMAPPAREDYREPGRLLAEEGYVQAGERIRELTEASAATS
jgi:uncharacterized peroxidase-related enzyme